MRPSGAELLGRARQLRPALLARQAEAERLRRLPAATIAEFHEAGIFRAIQPVASGCDYCAYLVAGAEAEAPDEAGRRPRRRFLLPIAGMEIIDDWHVGMSWASPASAASRCAPAICSCPSGSALPTPNFSTIPARADGCTTIAIFTG